MCIPLGEALLNEFCSHASTFFSVGKCSHHFSFPLARESSCSFQFPPVIIRLTYCVAAGETFNKDATEVVDIVFSTLTLYDDRHPQAAVVKLIIRGLEESSFVKVFAGTLVQNIERSQKNSSDAVRLKLLRWSCLLVAQVPSLLSAKSAFCRLATAQGFLLASLYQGPVRLRRATSRIFTHYLSNVRNSFLLM
jgi:hypothetical protein